MADLSPTFYIGTIHIETIESASCLNMGNNFPIGFHSYKKQNQGFGSISGNNNTIQDLRSVLRDSSEIEMACQTQEEEIPEWVRDLVKDKLELNEELLEDIDATKNQNKDNEV